MTNLIKLVAVSLLVVACGPTREVVQIVNGSNGANGSNGHSLVSQFVYVQGESLECTNGGSRLDIYLDLDDSLSVSESDLYSNSLVACNGTNGLNGANGADGQDGVNGANGEQGPQGIPGAQGPQGVAGPQGATGAQGVAGVAGPTGPAGAQGPQGLQGAQGPAGSGATITVYSSSSCTSITQTSYFTKSGYIYTTSNCSSNSKVSDLNGNDATLWVSSSALATSNNGSGIRVIYFN